MQEIGKEFELLCLTKDGIRLIIKPTQSVSVLINRFYKRVTRTCSVFLALPLKEAGSWKVWTEYSNIRTSGI